MRVTDSTPARVLLALLGPALACLVSGLDLQAQGNPLEPPPDNDIAPGDGNDGNPLNPPGDPTKPPEPPAQEPPKEVLCRATKEEMDAIAAKYDNEEKGEERLKSKLAAVEEALALDEARMVKLLMRAAGSTAKADEAVRKAAEEALAKKIAHLRRLFKNEAEEDRIAALELLILTGKPDAVRLCTRGLSDPSKKVADIAQKGLVKLIKDRWESKDPAERLSALCDAVELADEPAVKSEMMGIINGAVGSTDERLQEISIRFIAAKGHMQRSNFLPTILAALKDVVGNPAGQEFACSYIRAIGDYGHHDGVRAALQYLRDHQKFDRADAAQVKRNLAVFDALGRLRYKDSVKEIMKKWREIDETARAQETTPQTEDGRKVAQKYIGACAAAMFGLCDNLPGTAEPAPRSSEYADWTRWIGGNSWKLPFE
ncbi:MAG: hypothetical protein RDV41_00815 [Planctomycetota bacterium]|nr:hypothetical protein [Planctomycetota bacterium]